MADRAVALYIFARLLEMFFQVCRFGADEILVDCEVSLVVAVDFETDDPAPKTVAVLVEAGECIFRSYLIGPSFLVAPRVFLITMAVSDVTMSG